MNKEIAAVLVCCVVGNIGDIMSGIAISGNATENCRSEKTMKMEDEDMYWY